MKRYLGSYLRRVYPQLLIFILFSMVFYITFKVSNLGMEYYYMDIEIMIFFMLAYLIFILVGHKKSLSMADQVDNLTFEKKQLINKMTNEKNDMRDYYTIWIHQMKTPITVANLLVDEMDEDNTRLKNDLKKELMYIEDYTNMAMTYLKIVNRQADMDLTSVYLDDIIRSVLKKYSMVFISNHISIDYKPMDISVVSDYSWLSILVEQLVSNAAKYTSNGSVKFVFHRESNSLEIRDTGIGIRPEDIPKIFDRGYSGFNGRLNQKSSGLGLFLATSISSKLSINIRVESELGVGSSFFLDFPKERDYRDL